MFATIYQVSEKDGMLVVRVPQLDVPDTRTLDDLGLSVGDQLARPHGIQMLQRVWRRILAGGVRHPSAAASLR